MTRLLSSLKFVPAALFLTACVTINVYFPEAAAEKAADRIIEDVWGESAAPDAQSRRNELSQPGLLDDAGSILLAAAGNVLDLIVPPAHAQADINISTPAIRQITGSMEARHAQLKKHYDSGAIGLTDNGLIEVRDQNAIPLPERNAVRKLVADENQDRNNLYREIASANSHPDWEADIRKTFSERWIQRAAGGWYYKQGGGWKQK
jgi:uncharacterized protein YdbL (DUF1318 family)